MIKSGVLAFPSSSGPIGTSWFAQLHADLLTGDLLASTAIMSKTTLSRKRERSHSLELTDSSSEVKRYHEDIELRELSEVAEEQQPPAEEQEDPVDDPAEEQQLPAEEQQLPVDHPAEEQQLPAEEPPAEGPQPEHDNQQSDQEDSPHEISNRDDQEDQWHLVDAATEEGQRSTPQGGPPAPGRAGVEFRVAVNRSRSGSNTSNSSFNILRGYNMQFDMYYLSQRRMKVHLYILDGSTLVPPLKACLRMNLKGQSASEVIKLDYSWDKVGEHQKEAPYIIPEGKLSQYIRDGILHFSASMTIK